LLGATLVPISTWSRPRELEYVLNHCDASTLVTVDRFLGQDYLATLAEMAPGSARLPRLRRVVALGGERRPGLTRFEDLADLGRDVTDAEIDGEQRALTPEDIAYILYTSGTTSTPKGVQLQHRGLIENMWSIGERQHLTAEDRMWMGISLFWGFGCENALLAVMTHGGSVVLQEQFEAGEALALIERERCTVYYGTPNIALALWQHPGEVGEIVIRGYMTPGYYKDSEKNAEAFDADGFFRSGDFGTFDDDGRLRFRGRLKEMVKTGGINVAPLEVEEVLLGHPAVEQVYVIGLPDPRREEVLAAVVVLKEGGDVSAEALRVFCRERLAGFKVPHVFRFAKRAELPVTATG